jgi:hypothetical protein
LRFNFTLPRLLEGHRPQKLGKLGFLGRRIRWWYQKTLKTNKNVFEFFDLKFHPKSNSLSLSLFLSTSPQNIFL